MKYYLILILMTLLGAFAGYFFKSASGAKTKIQMLLNKNTIIGGVLYSSTAVLNIYVLKYLEYSIVLPFTALTYFWTIILSKLFLNEVLSKRKVIGIFLIIFGVWVLTLK